MTRNRSPASAIDLVLLGFLLDGDHSAYEMQKMIEYRNLAAWVRISVPSVYKKALALEKKGYMTGTVAREGNMPEKTVYAITEKGRVYHGALMKAVAQAFVPVHFDFNAVISCLGKIPSYEAKVLLDEIRASVEKSRAYVASHVPLRTGIPLAGRSIMDQQLRVYDALLGWLGEYSAALVADGIKK